jgi:hypothetical protein
MTGKELWAQYQSYTRDITEHGRKLGFAGAAICWVFKKTDLTFPNMIYIALAFFVAYFIADILHQFTAALTLKFFIQHEEKRLFKKTRSIEGNILKPRWVDWPAFTFFIIKCVLLLAGFVFIGLYLKGLWEWKHVYGMP